MPESGCMATCYNQGVRQNRRRPWPLYSIIEYKLIPPHPSSYCLSYAVARSRGLAQRPPRSLITPHPPGRAQFARVHDSVPKNVTRRALQYLHHPSGAVLRRSVLPDTGALVSCHGTCAMPCARQWCIPSATTQ